MSLETEFQSYLRRCATDNPEKLFHVMKHMRIEGLEVPLYSPMSLITREVDPLNKKSRRQSIGRIDIIFRYKHTTYVGEIKDYDPIRESFWYATKALAYCEYLKWQTDNHSYKPAVIIPSKSLRLEHQIVAGRLDIHIFIFDKSEDGFTMRMMDDRPYWQQLQKT